MSASPPLSGAETVRERAERLRMNLTDYIRSQASFDPARRYEWLDEDSLAEIERALLAEREAVIAELAAPKDVEALAFEFYAIGMRDNYGDPKGAWPYERDETKEQWHALARHGLVRESALRQRIVELEQELTWFQITEAPRDGMAILACDDRTADGCQEVVFWDDDHRAAPYFWVTQDGPRFHKDRFTHWKPLSKTPSHRARQAKEPQG